MDMIKQRVVIDACDWGPAIAKTILHFNKLVSEEYGEKFANSIKITERKEAFDWQTVATKGKEAAIERIVAEAPIEIGISYTSDEYGNRMYNDSEFVAIEIKYGPKSASPFCFDGNTFFNTMCNPYELVIDTPENLCIDSSIDLNSAYIPSIKGVDVQGKFIGKDGKVLHYASYEPTNKVDNKKHPLMIWLHGAGEGGVDPNIVLLGNKVTALFQDEFQSIMDGAFVLAPQTDYFWLCYNDKKEAFNNPGKDSVYLQTLLELIHQYIDEHKEIDTNRIYISGCSNGGFMTMCLLLNEPELFAAAVPICEAYNDAGIDNQRLSKLKNVPIWFVYAKNDELVDPNIYEIPTIERLKALGVEVHASVYDGVFDQSGLYKTAAGTPYEYSGHWSWLYFFNNACSDNGVSIWEWLASKHK